jgi:thymidine kinase
MLYLKLSTVNAGKSMNLLASAYEYASTNKPIMILKPSTDTRNEGYIYTRAGLAPRECETFSNDVELLKKLELAVEKKATVFIDEIQFCDIPQCEIIKAVAQDINIICYGLLSDYKAQTFPAISCLLAEMPSVDFIKSMCHFCNDRARMNLRVVGGVPVYEGESISPEVMGEEAYYKVCPKCYYNPPEKI